MSFIVNANFRIHIPKEATLMFYRFLYLSSFLIVSLTLSNSSRAYTQADIDALVISVHAADSSTAATPPANQCWNYDLSGYDFSAASRVCATPAGGGEGWANVWKRHRFAWEYEGKHANLDAAFNQLRQYVLAHCYCRSPWQQTLLIPNLARSNSGYAGNGF